MKLLAALFALGFTLTSVADETVLRLHGSNTIGANLAPTLVEAWMAMQGMTGITRAARGYDEQTVTGRDPQGGTFRVEISAHGSATAFTELAAGHADLGMSSRPIKPEEQARLAALGSFTSPRAEYVIGLDGIAVIVHPRNPVAVLNKSTVARIFSGELRDWKQLGGAPGAIHLYARDDKSGTFDTFKSLVLDKTPLATEARRFESSSELSDAVAADPGAIGFIGLPYVRRAKLVAIAEGEAAALAPNAFTVATEDYALARRLFFYLPPDRPHPLAKSLAEFAVAARGQELLVREGFVAQTIVTGSAGVSPEAPDDYRSLTKGARRLSINFRFHEGSHRPDTKALRDAARVAEFMARPENARRHLMLCGFADSGETLPLYSLDLSIRRADGIADLLLSKGVRPLRVRGYGSVAPVAANDTPVGRYKNRRVELWIR